MKKCPNCQKTYEDNLKYCQSDGTPLVVVAEDKPSADPYKTMVASNLDVPAEEPAAEEPASEEPEPAPLEALESTPVEPEEVVEAEPVETAPSEPLDVTPAVIADPVPIVVEDASPSEAVDDVIATDDEGDFLEIPEKEDPIDPMKTMVVTGSQTSDSIRIPDLPEAPEEAPEEEEAAVSAVEEDTEEAADESEFPISEAATILSPEIPKFSEPNIEPPDLGAPDSGSGLFGEKTPESAKPSSKSSVPIPSPFDQSMPPGYAVPESSPFEDAVPDVESKLEDGGAKPPASPFAESPIEPSASGDLNLAPSTGDVPAMSSDSDPFGSNEILSAAEGLAGPGEGDNKTLAIVSLVTGILSVLCCAGGILLGPIALILGYMAKGKIAADPSEYGGGTFANIGMGLGVLGILLSIVVIVLNLFSIVGSF